MPRHSFCSLIYHFVKQKLFCTLICKQNNFVHAHSSMMNKRNFVTCTFLCAICDFALKSSFAAHLLSSFASFIMRLCYNKLITCANDNHHKSQANCNQISGEAHLMIQHDLKIQNALLIATHCTLNSTIANCA